MVTYFYTPIQERKEFAFEGDTLRFKTKNEETNYYLYERFNENGTLVGYEVVKPVRIKQPDGTEADIYPATERFGKYGWSFPPNTPMDKLNYYLEGRHKQQPYYEFKRQEIASQ